MATAEDRCLDLPGRPTIHVRDWGGTGRPLALVHGLASNARIWDLVAPRLLGVGQPVAFDQRGHGQSDKPDSGYDAGTVAADLRAALAALGPVAGTVVVGHSWGASVALRWAADHADEVRGVVCVDGGASPWSLDPTMTWERLAERLAPPQLRGARLSLLVDRIRSGPLGPVWSQEVEAAVLGNFERFGDGTIAPHLTRERHMAILRSMWDEPASALYGRIRCPALFLMVAPAAADEAAARRRQAVAAAVAGIEQARLVWLEDTIHDVPLHRPALVAEHLAAFVRELG